MPLSNRERHLLLENLFHGDSKWWLWTANTHFWFLKHKTVNEKWNNVTITYLTSLLLYRSSRNAKHLSGNSSSLLLYINPSQSIFCTSSAALVTIKSHLVELVTIKRNEFYCRGRCSAICAGSTGIIKRLWHFLSLCKEKIIFQRKDYASISSWISFHLFNVLINGGNVFLH